MINHKFFTEEEQLEYVEQVRKLTVMDDRFMRVVFKDKLACQEFIRTVLQKDDLVIEESISQAHLFDPDSREVVADVMAKDSEGNLYNIEIQNSPDPYSPKRIRYHSSKIDTNSIGPGTDYKDLPDKYIIYVTFEDRYNDNRLLSLIRRTNQHTGEPIDDGEYIYIFYVYGERSSDDEIEIEKLANFLTTSEPGNKDHGALSDRVTYLKTQEEGKDEIMSYVRAIEDEIRDHYDKEFKREFELLEAEHQKELDEEREKAEAEYKKEFEAERISNIKDFYRSDVPIETISNVMGVSKDEIISIVQEETAPYETD